MMPELLACAAIASAGSANRREVSEPVETPVKRKELLRAKINPDELVSNVDVQEIIMGPGVKAALHLHSCPTLGVIVEGGISFQIEGQAVQYLKAGDAFYEPMNVRVAKFDNEAEVPAKFVVFYLCGKDVKETIRILNK